MCFTFSSSSSTSSSFTVVPPDTVHCMHADMSGYYCADNDKATFPVDAPPTHVELKVPVGHTALAVLTQPSHLPLLTLIVAPDVTALSWKSAVPELPSVELGAPSHFVIAPAIPPQILNSATF